MTKFQVRYTSIFVNQIKSIQEKLHGLLTSKFNEKAIYLWMNQNLYVHGHILVYIYKNRF